MSVGRRRFGIRAGGVGALPGKFAFATRAGAGPSRIAGGLAVLAALLLPALSVGQLPPDIILDSYLLQVEQAVRDGDAAGARAAINKILALQKEHEVDLPDDFHFRDAKVADLSDLPEQALNAVVKYLAAAGREGRHYAEALELMNKAQAEVEELKERRELLVREREAREREREAREREVGKIRAGLARDIPAAMGLVRIPAGRFRMGSTSAEALNRERPVRKVRISQGFYMGKYEVTQGQWEAVMGSAPSYFKECGLDCPVEGVSWDDVQEFMRRLNALEGEATYRLPTEAEWEYAARAGTAGDRYAGNSDPIAWYEENSGDRTHPVGQKAPNAFGLHDMLGNVWEWVQDWYGDYPGGAVTDPRGPGSGSFRVLRGGSWSSVARSCRASDRYYNSPGTRYDNLGFRLLRAE